MGTLSVQLADLQYDVHIGSDVYDLFSTKYRQLLSSADQVGIIADETVAKHHLPVLCNALQQAGVEPKLKVVPSGEQCKTAEVYIDCQSYFLRENFTRQSILIAFGGGACGDLTGFVAATYMRGIRFIQCPTTILSHDSAVGGKTAINLPEGKNMVGSFHQPSAVLFHTDLFQTLPPREMRSGLAELVKHAFISDADWSYELLRKENFTSPSVEWLSTELLKGIQVKADIVAEDTFEHSSRKFLNFGHTFGHAVEAVYGYGGLSHGDCVVIGMVYSLIASEQYGEIESSFTNEFIDFAKANGYPFEPVHEHSFEAFLPYMLKDKKATFGNMHFVLLQNLGLPFVQQMTIPVCHQIFDELKRRV